MSAKKADFYEIGKKFKIDPVVARLIRNRDIITEEEINRYLNGDIKDLYNPETLKDGVKGASILKDKIKEKRKIRIIGDYDIDGVISTYILFTGLTKCGATVDFEIPDRIKDGYGINEHLIELAWKDGIDTIITCDNGISAISQIDYAKSLGLTVIVTDHHDIPYIEEEGVKKYLFSQADAIINPKQNQCEYPFKSLCGAGVVYKFLEILYKELEIPHDEIEQFIEYVAIATVGDVMDLVDENRIFVKAGLAMLQKTKNLGLQSLIEVTGLSGMKLCAYHIGFVLGPCINASGRLDTAKRALELLISETKSDADCLAAELKSLNDSRKDMTQEGLMQAIELIESSSIKCDKVLIVYLKDCHESLAGIIAGRLREKYQKPIFVLTKGEESVKGSGRSIEAYHMFEGLISCKELLIKFGGHPLAAGLSLPEENIENFKNKINKNCGLTEEDFIPKISIDVPMPIDYIRENLIEELELLEPFGKGNPKPLFAEKNLSLLSGRVLGKNQNVLKLRILSSSDTFMEAMYFGSIPDFNDYLRDKFGEEEVMNLYAGKENNISLSFTYYPTINEYGGNRTIQVVIQNYQ